MPCALGHPIYPSGSSAEPNFTPLLNCYPTSEQNINCMPLLLLTSCDITEIWWQLVISIFNSWEVFCMAALLSGVVFNMLSSFLWKADSPRGPRSRFLCTWTDQGLRCAIRLQGSYQVQMVSSPSRQMFSTAAWIFPVFPSFSSFYGFSH